MLLLKSQYDTTQSRKVKATTKKKFCWGWGVEGRDNKKEQVQT